MSQPIVGTNNQLIAELQGQSQSSSLITVFEVSLPDSDIGGPGVDKLYFHDGSNGTADITWYSLLNDNDFGSTSTSKYGQQTYSAFPVESEGWEVRGSGTLPRPTVRFANINQYWSAHLSNYDDLIGAKVIRRRTLQKHLGTNPPIEFNRDVYYVERKTTETATLVEFELASAFDVQGVSLPRRSIVAARCPWKYKDPEQGGCDWPADSRPNGDSGVTIPNLAAETPLYFDKDDNRLTSFTTWSGQTSTTSALHGAASYSVGDYVEYGRPLGGLIAVTQVQGVASTNKVTFTVASHEVTSSDQVIAKGFTQDYKAVPLDVSSTTSTTIVVNAPVSSNYTLGGSSATIGYLNLCRVTLYRCITAHTVSSTDSADDIIKPTNISYWELGDVCGKRLNSCAIRYGHDAAGSGVTSIIVDKTDGGVGGGSGYSTAPTVVFSSNNVDGEAHGGSGASATAVISSGKVIRINMVSNGSGYNSAPAVSLTGGGGSGATITANINTRGTRNVSLPFGGFPGAALY